MGLLDDNLIDVSDDIVNYMMSLGKRYHICININNFYDATDHISTEKLIHILGRKCDAVCPVYMNGVKLMHNIPNKIKYISNIVSNWSELDLDSILNDDSYIYKLILPWYERSYNSSKICIQLYKYTGLHKVQIAVYTEDVYSFCITISNATFQWVY
jgi:hypothetical protein